FGRTRILPCKRMAGSTSDRVRGEWGEERTPHRQNLTLGSACASPSTRFCILHGARLAARPSFGPLKGRGKLLLPFRHRHISPFRRAGVDLPRAADLLVWVFQHFLPLRNPAHGAVQGEQ